MLQIMYIIWMLTTQADLLLSSKYSKVSFYFYHIHNSHPEGTKFCLL